MPGSIVSRSVIRPRSLAAALRHLRENDPGVLGALTPMAGCTDLYVSLNFGTLREMRFLDLWSLDALRTIEMREGRLWIGALATHTDLIRSRLVQKRVPMLAAAAREIGGVQIQNRGTIGGNVANASPAGDTLPVLAAVDALVHLGSADGQRTVPFSSFYTGYRQTVRRSDELITGFEIPKVDGRQAFRKIGTRAAQAISKVVVGAVLGDDPRIAIGSVAPTVVRLRRAEAAIASGASTDEVRQAIADEIEPIDDVRSTAEYRRRVACNVVTAMLSSRG